MRAGLTETLRGIVEYRCGREQRTTGKRCSKLFKKALVGDELKWLGTMTINEQRGDDFHTLKNGMVGATPAESVMDGMTRWTFHCHPRCGNTPTVTATRALREGRRALADGSGSVFL